LFPLCAPPSTSVTVFLLVPIPFASLHFRRHRRFQSDGENCNGAEANLNCVHAETSSTGSPLEADSIGCGWLAGLLTCASTRSSCLPGNPSGLFRSSSPRSQWRGRAGFSPTSQLHQPLLVISYGKHESQGLIAVRR